jgi:hypothetical protein
LYLIGSDDKEDAEVAEKEPPFVLFSESGEFAFVFLTGAAWADFVALGKPSVTDESERAGK